MSKKMLTPFGDYHLQRIPDTDKNLFAWNSADQYLLKHVYELLQNGAVDLNDLNILIINDAFGALSVPLSQFACVSYSDSFISHQAIIDNIKHCCPEHLNKVSLLKSTDQLTGHYDVVLFKEVKSKSFFKDIITQLSQHLKPDALIIGAIMAKNLQKNTLELLNKILGPTHASLAWKKSRLIFVSPDETKISVTEAHIQNSVVTFQMDENLETIYNLSNVFSRQKLDIGTRFFLQHLPEKRNYNNIIDLGCGNGILALTMAKQSPGATVTCIDESYMAIASAKMTLSANLSPESQIHYRVANALTGVSQDSADLILCNPPFHQQYVVGDAIAWQMFKQAKQVLVKGGELWIVGNRHLSYHLKLQKIFANYKLIASSNKFVVLKAVKN